MPVIVREANKKPGVVYAIAEDGLELPVIDITHPAFAVDMTEQEISEIIDQTMRDLRASAGLPAHELKAMIARSVLLRGTLASAGTFMSGMMTYLHRLGPDNLGEAWASDVDRRHAGSIMPLSFRFRLRDVAHELARVLAESPLGEGGRPLDLVNIAGGPSLDSINALILLAKEHPAWLAGRTIRIRVLDVDAEGPSFGKRALEALFEGPLAGASATLEHVPYDFGDPSALARCLAPSSDHVLVAASTEGGLFDYGSDEVIVQNLEALRVTTPRDFRIVGSVVRDVETLDPRLRMTATLKNRPAVRYLGLAAFQKLAHAGGWEVAGARDSTAHHVVRLHKR